MITTYGDYCIFFRFSLTDAGFVLANTLTKVSETQDIARSPTSPTSPHILPPVTSVNSKTLTNNDSSTRADTKQSSTVISSQKTDSCLISNSLFASNNQISSKASNKKDDTEVLPIQLG